MASRNAEAQKRYYLKNKERLIAERVEYRRQHPRTYMVCDREYQRAYHEKHKARRATRARANLLMRDYGMTVEEYDAMWSAQGQACAVCGTKELTGKGWHVDHDHNTGKVRGILCLKCNVALGMTDENIDRLLDLANYLREYRGPS